jgi:hypothetical protein
MGSDFQGEPQRGGPHLGELPGGNLCRSPPCQGGFPGANLRGANFNEAKLSDANFRAATMVATVFANVDLSGTRGLDSCYHTGPSHLDHLTQQRSGRLPLAFLRGCGLSDWQIEAAKLHEPGLTSEQITKTLYEIHKLRSTRPIQIHNLFISYSHADTLFVEHMEGHLNERGIRFWRDIHDAPAGPLETIVVRAIRHNPTVLLVLSQNSVRSDWVEFEAQTARELERELGRHVLCPLALDNRWLTCKWSAVLRNQIRRYNVLDFSDWQNAPAFKSKFERLLSGIHLFYGHEGQ